MRRALHPAIARTGLQRSAQRRNGDPLSTLCKAELDAAENRYQAAEHELKAIIARSPHNDDAYAARSTLTQFYLRAGHFKEANAEIVAMLTEKPRALDLQNVRSLFALLAAGPDLTVVRHRQETIPLHTIDGNVFAPITVKGSKRAFMLDTGLNLSMMSESEAKSLGLRGQLSDTAVSDISGLKGSGAQIVFVNRLLIAGMEIRHVPFLVVKDDNGAFVGIPPGQRGILGIQPLLALQTLTFGARDTLSFAGENGTASHSSPLLFDGAFPLTQVVFQGRPLTVTFDMGATQTTLNPPFAKTFPHILAERKI